MAKIKLGAVEGEPARLDDYYAVLARAQRIDVVCTYIVPAILQTEDYAVATLQGWYGEEAAQKRAKNRMARERAIREADIPQRVTFGAEALSNLHIAGKAVMLDQIDRVEQEVQRDLDEGDSSMVRVGIVPYSFVPLLPAGLPAGLRIDMPQDISTINTVDGMCVMGMDYTELGYLHDEGERGDEARRRFAMMGGFIAQAVYDEEALELVRESRSIIFQA